MNLLARREMLALAAVLDIALHARPEPVAAKALANRLGLPPRHLEPLLQMLVRKAILRGVRGPKGGYELARERRRISVADVLRASLGDGEPANEPACALIDSVITPVAVEASAAVLEQFEGMTIDDLSNKAFAETSAPSPLAANDFII